MTNQTGLHILITGAAGFIGSHLCERLLASGHRAAAVDNFDSFYDPAIKRSNVARLSGASGFTLIEADVRDTAGIEAALDQAGIRNVDALVHLAARAGVRPSIEDPILYSQINGDGTTAMLELARRLKIRRFIFASSSSVYGNNRKVPFSENDRVEQPISPYAATKRAGELMCHTYHHLFGLSVVCLRFFTVYGPRQRPDLAIHKFARLMMQGKPIPMYGDGSTERDYTYITDILQGIEGAIEYSAIEPSVYEIVNLGGNRTTPLRKLVDILAESLDIQPAIRQLPQQAGDVERTFADVRKAAQLLGYAPATPIEEGIPEFVEWFRRSVVVDPGHK